MLDPIALQHGARDLTGFHGSLSELRETFTKDDRQVEPNHFDLRAFTVFQLAQ